MTRTAENCEGFFLLKTVFCVLEQKKHHQLLQVADLETTNREGFLLVS